MAITHQRSIQKFLSCKSTKSMWRNGGEGSKKRARICQVCSKRVTGKMIPLILESQLGTACRAKGLAAAQNEKALQKSTPVDMCLSREASEGAEGTSGKQ